VRSRTGSEHVYHDMQDRPAHASSARGRCSRVVADLVPRIASFWILAVAATLEVACRTVGGGGAQTAASTRAVGASNVHTGTAAPEDAEDPRMTAEVAEYLRFHPSLWSGASPVAAVTADRLELARALPDSAKPPRPAKIRAYAWAEASGCRTRSALGAPFESDGTPCRGVVGSADLTREESAAVQGLAESMDAGLRAGAKVAVVRCDFDPHHALVYLDENDVTIAVLEPCFLCHQWRIRPSSRPDVMNDREPPVMSEEQRSVLGGILDAHHLGAWTLEEGTERVRRVSEYLRRVYGGYSMRLAAEGHSLTARGRALQAAWVAKEPDVDRDASPKRSSAQDRERLCAWYQGELEAQGQQSGGGFECANGVRYVLSLGDGNCEASALACDRSVRDIEDCLRAFARGPDAVCQAGFPRACVGLGACAVGVRGFVDPRSTP